jgi:hypothetical protein
VCRSVARVIWGKPVFRLTASSQLAESLARGRVQIQRDGTSQQVGTEAKCRGMEADRFGQDIGGATKMSFRC